MLFTPFTFPNGKTAKKRIFKSAMEEQLAQNGFSVSGKPPAGKLDRDAEYCYFYGQTR